MAFTFGQTQPPAFSSNPSTSTSFGFGTQPAASVAPSFGFSSNLQPTAPTFGFGTSTAAPSQPLGGSTGLQFGATSSAAPTFGFGGQASTAPAAGTSSFSFGTGLGGFGTSQPSTLSFGTTPAAGTQAPILGGFGQQQGFGLTGTQPAAASTGFSLVGFSLPSTTVSAGLGGVTTTSLGGGFSATGTQAKQDAKAIKENPIPNEINQSVEDFKKFVKDQKVKKEEVGRGSEKSLEKVSKEIEALRKLLATLSSGVQRHVTLANKLKYDVALEFQNVEIAQRTKETAASMQIDNVAPLKYFFRLVSSFEENMQAYRQQIDEIERDLTALNRQQSLTPQELTGGLKKIHEALISLASKVYSVHSALQNFKENYLDYRRRYHGDTTDIFAARNSGTLSSAAAPKHSTSSAKSIAGPAPFSGSSGTLSRTLANLNNPPRQGNISGLMPSNSAANITGTATGGLSLFGASTGLANTSFGLLGGNPQGLQPVENRSFQLQSPPPGNKRNKR